MITHITEDHVEENVLTYTAFASELGWHPGIVPVALTTSLGNGKYLTLESSDEEVFKYKQLLGCIELQVYND